MKNLSLLLSIVILTILPACTTTQATKNVKDTPEAITNAPVKALNLKKRKIPKSLKELNNPYDTPQAVDCESISAELTELTEFLGPDWDSPDHYSKKGRTSGEFFDAILPYGGLVRFVSGASEHEKKVIQAISYGTVRRATLKTKGASLGCSSPASPSFEN